MDSSATLLRQFVARLLEREGMLVEEAEPEGLEFIASPRLQEALKVPEFGRFGFAEELPEGAQRIQLESDWLERFARVLEGRGRTLRRVLNLPLPALASPDKAAEQALVLPNAVYRVAGAAPAWTRCSILTFRYAAISDEMREGVFQIGINLSTGCLLDGLVDRLLEEGSALESPQDGEVPPEADLPPSWSEARLHQVIAKALPQRLRRELTPFINGMQRRLERDLERVYAYYQALRLESLNRLRKQGGEDPRQQLRLEAIAREYLSKVADLKQKYAMRIDIELAQTLELEMPVQRLELLIKRRKRERRFSLDWNPLARKLEPLPCEHGYSPETARLVCDDALHFVSPAAHGPCARCGKEYCRACHPRSCPRCTKGA
ncbi:MAG: hypothetical protein HY717_22125 [Planctomycetes bacterium]|nr:hypothetical protein [Planctomycetota bacterium]